MLDRNIVADVLTAALSTGGDFAEIFVENTEENGIVMTNSKVESAQWGIDYGCGIRIFDGFGAIYAYTNDTSRDNLIKIAKQAAAAVSARGKVGANDTITFDCRKAGNIHNIAILPTDGDNKHVVECLKRAAAASYAYDKRVTQTNGSYRAHVQDVLIANSEGLWVTDRRVRTRVAVSAVASSDAEKQTGSFSPGAMQGYEFVDSLDFDKLGKDSAEIAVKMLLADLCPGGKMPVVIGNGFGGVIFHEACGHSLEATSVAKGASEFCGKLGQQIASPIVTAIDDGTVPNYWGSINVDDEGTPSRKNVLIENGILKTYLVDRLNGKKMGMESTGSSRRQSYLYAPTSRMTNTFIASGTDKHEDIIADTEYGLYAAKMGGGSVQPATGEFNFAVTEAYIIRNGKIAEPVRGATLIGKGGQVLMDIDKIADNLYQEQGMCGSISGSVPTNVGQPTIRVKEILVGGRK